MDARAGPEPFRAVVRDRVEFWSVLAEEQGRSFAVHMADGPMVVPASTAALADAVDAILGNVFAHTPDGTALEVALISLVAGADNAERCDLLVRVDDAGPGFADTAVLARGVSGGGSTGLGLDIARRTAESAGGRLQLSRSLLGGARVELVLPSWARHEVGEAKTPSSVS